MSQNDFNIANQGFPSFRSDLNGALQALASNSAGTSAPATTYAYMWWYDSTNNILKVRNADNDAWIDFASFDQVTDAWSFASVVIDGDLAVDTDTLFVDSTNNYVGVGTATPTAPLDVYLDDSTLYSETGAASLTSYMRILNDSSTTGTLAGIELGSKNDAGTLGLWHIGSVSTSSNYDNHLVFHTRTGSGTYDERMRISSTGNVLIGKTSADSGATAGVQLEPDGLAYFTRTSTSAVFNRLSTDGTVVSIRKDGTVAGAIATYGGVLAIEGVVSAGPQVMIRSNGNTSLVLGSYQPNDAYGYIGDTSGGGVAMGFISDGCDPVNASDGTPADNTFDIGDISRRWDDIYATNGTIQTSDANEKQQIAELTAAEVDAAKAISKLFKTFKWNDSVAEKGDAARIHSGVIAQEVEAAMTAAGLDAGRYAFFISSTWWESTEVIPAVEEVLDEEGNVVTEAQAERTVTHQHETAEEAPEGAVERTRKGIRYPQLLSFIGAATEQRLASIEARLDAAGL